MATGRTGLNRWRVYVDGYDMSGHSRSFGPLACTFDEGVDDAISLSVKARMTASAMVSFGNLNGIFDNTATSGIHTVMASSSAVTRDVLAACGFASATAPANNDPCFAGQFDQLGYYGNPADNPVTATIPFANTSGLADNLAYAKPWGVLLHANAAATAANSATGLDQTAQTTKGGWMMYHVLAGDGTAAIKVQDASTNSDGSFGDLLSSGTIDCSSPTSGVVALAKTATVDRYVRWQVALGTATTVTFVLGFFRNNIT